MIRALSARISPTEGANFSGRDVSRASACESTSVGTRRVSSMYARSVRSASWVREIGNIANSFVNMRKRSCRSRGGFVGAEYSLGSVEDRSAPLAAACSSSWIAFIAFPRFLELVVLLAEFRRAEHDAAPENRVLAGAVEKPLRERASFGLGPLREKHP